MKTARLVALSSIAFVALLAGAANAADAPRAATLTVTGDGSVTQAPDRAIISFQIQTTDAESAKATSANATIANAVTARMTQLGLPASATATSGYGLNYVPRPTRPDPANDQRYGYTVTRTIDVTVDGTDRAGAIVDAGVAAGATNVNGVAFQLRDPHAAQRAAQTAALNDAVQQARSLAAAAGVRLVRIVAITPGGNGGVRPLPMERVALSAARTPTTIEPGNLTVQANVTVRYEIAPAR